MHQTKKQAQRALLLILRRDPWTLGYEQTRWTLQSVRAACPWLRLSTDSGLSRVLDQLAISYKRGRNYVHSPDPDYEQKRAYIADCLDQVRRQPDRFVLLYLDECTYYRQPSLAQAYEARGPDQMQANWGRFEQTGHRIIGALNALDARVHYQQHRTITRADVLAFYQDLAQAYAQAETIFVVLDNWPVHFHAEIYGHLAQQQWPWPLKQPWNWPVLPEGPTVTDPLPLQLVFLPSYASWLNPIEKLWRYLKQTVLHLHRMTEQWPQLIERVDAFLDRFALGSPDLLRYTGLLPN